MSPKRPSRKSSIKLSPENRERIAAAALEHPILGAKRLASILQGEGIAATVGAVRSVLKKQGLQTCELRLGRLEERHLNLPLALTEEQERALLDFNPCLRERHLDCRQPGQLLVQDAVDLGKLQAIGRTFLHAAIDPSCCLAFATLAASPEPAVSAALLKDQALVFYLKEAIAVQRVMAGKGIVSGAGVDPEYEKFLESQGIALTLPPAGDQPLNGFIERFERAVREGFLDQALDSPSHPDLGTLRSDFDDWLERFNRETPLAGYPAMGRAPLDAFGALRPADPPREKSGYIPPPEPQLAPVPVLPLSKIAAAPVQHEPRVLKKYEWTSGLEIWGFRAVNAALVCLIFYFGWVIVSIFLNGPRMEENPRATAAGQPVAAPAVRTPNKISRLGEYRAVWDRNLFGVSRLAEKTAAPEKIDVDKIALAGADVGLRLIGTVVASDPKLNYAVIDVAATRGQGIFREKERVGKAVIRLILRNAVIIETEDGSRKRLSTDEEAKGSKPGREGGPPAGSPAAAFNPDDIQGDGSTFQVPLDEVPSSPADVQRVMEELKLAPQMADGKMSGVSVGRLRAKDILSRIGLRTGDIIKGVDNEEFDSPEDLGYLFERLAQGGDMAVLVERRGRLQKLKINIQ